jgi:hypothetical protein
MGEREREGGKEAEGKDRSQNLSGRGRKKEKLPPPDMYLSSPGVQLTECHGQDENSQHFYSLQAQMLATPSPFKY